jgi:molybdopterin converting factor small subunit
VITVYLPAILRPHAGGADVLTINVPIQSMSELLAALERKAPRLVRQLDDSVFNFAVNDERLIHDAQAHPLKDGDRVEIVPAISGG